MPSYHCPFSATAGASDAVMTCDEVRQHAQAFSTVTINMTNANADLTYTAKVAGAEQDEITVTHVDPSANDAELGVEVNGTDIVVNLATNGAGAITTTAAQVVAAIEASAAASALVGVTDEGAGSGVVNAVEETALDGGNYHGCPLFNTTEGHCNMAMTYARSVRVAGGDVPDEA